MSTVAADRSYWEDVLYKKSYDLIVVGAGLTGQSAAHFYKKEHPGARVLIIERGHFPIGASTRNAGFVCFGTIGEHLADLKIESEERLRKRIKDRFEGLKLLRSTLGDDYIQYEPSGGWEIFTDNEKFEESASQAERFNQWLLDLTGEENVYETGEYRGYPAIFNRCEGMIHPGKMIRRLTELNIALGIEFRWNTAVRSVDTATAQIESESGHVFKSNNIVLSTNAFTSKLLSDKNINPGRGYIFITRPISSLNWKGTFHFNEGYVYFRNLGEDRMLIGGGRNIDSETEHTMDFGINESIKEYLIQFTNEIIQLPDGWEIEQEWSGIMGFTDSKSPILDKSGARCVIAAGLSGMGVALGMQLGKSAVSQF